MKTTSMALYELCEADTEVLFPKRKVYDLMRVHIAY